MTPIWAILLCCTAGDAEVAAAVHAAAVQAGVDPALALAVACRESGLRGRNPLGVMLPAPGGPGQVACHRTGQFDAAACMQLGAQSLANRLRGCHGDEQCALRRYNRSKGAAAYAAKVLRLARFVRQRGAP